VTPEDAAELRARALRLARETGDWWAPRDRGEVRAGGHDGPLCGRAAPDGPGTGQARMGGGTDTSETAGAF